eukprot:m.301454 g.301454  ORF g.301454 m.301454 type:complete len:125 (+) comp14776_c0_seq1:210-584(+)
MAELAPIVQRIEAATRRLVGPAARVPSPGIDQAASLQAYVDLLETHASRLEGNEPAPSTATAAATAAASSSPSPPATQPVAAPQPQSQSLTQSQPQPAPVTAAKAPDAPTADATAAKKACCNIQ